MKLDATLRGEIDVCTVTQTPKRHRYLTYRRYKYQRPPRRTTELHENQVDAELSCKLH